MFNEHYGLETATLNGSKTRTSRIEFHTNANLAGVNFFTKPNLDVRYAIFDFDNGKSYKSRYGIGEVVAIAQSYEDAENVIVKKIVSHASTDEDKILLKKLQSITSSPGIGNKMFVKSELMPHQIQITDIKLERMQDISDEDCIKEGIEISSQGLYFCKGIELKGAREGICKCFETPREAFASLIDKVIGKGTWAKNPWVVAYCYKLVK